MGHARREALWAIKVLCDEPLPLFAVASAREQQLVPEVDEAPFPLPHGRGDEFARGPSAPDPRDARPKGMTARDIFVPDLHIYPLKLKTRDFR